MAKAAIGTATVKFIKAKRTKSERTKPNRPKRKPYRGQGKP